MTLYALFQFPDNQNLQTANATNQYHVLCVCLCDHLLNMNLFLSITKLFLDVFVLLNGMEIVFAPSFFPFRYFGHCFARKGLYFRIISKEKLIFFIGFFKVLLSKKFLSVIVNEFNNQYGGRVLTIFLNIYQYKFRKRDISDLSVDNIHGQNQVSPFKLNKFTRNFRKQA